MENFHYGKGSFKFSWVTNLEPFFIMTLLLANCKIFTVIVCITKEN